jgi:uncharacterized protein YbjT (DUF2867 family)
MLPAEMNVIVFGGTGMIGQGVIRECLIDPGVERVLTIGRSATGIKDGKLRELVHHDMWRYDSVEAELSGLDACFFCLGVSSVGMNEADYERVTVGIAVAAAETLVRLNPSLTFVYVSGAGSDSSERGRIMWARVKGKAENAILRLFESGYVFRPGVVQPLHGIRSRTAAYRVLYSITAPLLPLVRRLMPGYILTTEQFGRAMLVVARRGAPKRVLENRDIAALADG